MRKKAILAVLTVFGTLALGATAHAASINEVVGDGINAYPNTIVEFAIIDDSRETLVNSDGSVLERVPGTPPTYQYVGGAAAADTTLDMGDKLRGIFRAYTYEVNSTGTQAFSPTFEVTAIFETEVIGKTALGGGLFSFAFGPSASFAAELAGLANVTATAAELAGTMVAVFEDQTPNYSVASGTLAAQTLTAVDGSAWAFLGFTGAGMTAAAGEGWLATPVAGDDITALPSNLLGGLANISLNRLAVGHSLSSSLTILPVQIGAFGPTPVEFTATATFQGQSSNSPSNWPVKDQTTLFFSAIPSPVAIGPGLVMLGGLFFSRRRRSTLAAA
jgi:hypothetical protein